MFKRSKKPLPIITCFPIMKSFVLVKSERDNHLIILIIFVSIDIISDDGIILCNDMDTAKLIISYL